MKAFLMHPDTDFDLKAPPPTNADDLTQDLELDTVLQAMAAGDKYLLEIARKAVLASLTDLDHIVYRQHVLADCLAHPDVVKQIYDIAVAAIMGERQIWGYLFRNSPDSILSRALKALELFADKLKELRRVTDKHAAQFHSEGFTRFFAMLTDELDDAYFHTIQEHLTDLRFPHGALISARLGAGLKGTDYLLRRPLPRTWKERLLGARTGFTFTIPPRDDNGHRALSELRDRGINLAANAVGQATDHILNFFHMLRSELAFYIGCLNLHDTLTAKDEPVCFPTPAPAGTLHYSAQGLYDASLTLTIPARAVGNDVHADGKQLVIVTGANQGGKSTFLRSVGLAQLMTQCGMFAPAQSLDAEICEHLYTHFKREEDATMESGKLDEELSRMSAIADTITRNCILLCNESFAATNEREGSQIARQIVQALTDNGVKILYVTHLYDLAHGFQRANSSATLFLRAERQPDGRRTYRLHENEPLPTSYGEDLYHRIFGKSPAERPVTGMHP
jgi:hypothetical protein